MAKVNYVTCPSCARDYYIEKMLSRAIEAKPGLKLKCPFCKTDFSVEQKSSSANEVRKG